MMLAQGWLLVCALMAARALNPVAHQSSQESLRSALDAVVRKQRSLDPSTQEYYNDLHAFKYHGGDAERKFDREGHHDCQTDEEDEEIEFLPSETGQLETVGNGFQDLNNKLLERVLMDYTKNIPEQVSDPAEMENAPEQEAEPVQSMFRERERSGTSRKRAGTSDRSGIEGKELPNVVLVELQPAAPYGINEMTNDDLDSLRVLYNKYGADQANKPYDNAEGPMSWEDLLNKEALLRAQAREAEENEYVDRDRDQSVLYLSPAERRNVNGRYPIGRDLRTYSSLMKRYPVAKRSAKPLASKKQITDPKVAQDLGALFGIQSTESPNDTHIHSHEHDHDHSHDHSHDHNHDHDHAHTEHNHEATSEAPKMTAASVGEKENATKNTEGKPIVVRKKSIDWSQYFGIDRRKKKASFMPRQGTQSEDDQWMLQRYYENMAENLRPFEEGYEGESDRKDRLEQSDSRLKGIENLVQGIAELRKLNDKLLADKVVLEKLRKALDELKVNVAARAEAQNQRISHPQSNGTSSFRENERTAGMDDKRSRNAKEEESEEAQTCPELDAIEKRCKAADTLAGDGTHMLYLPCVMLQICRACVQDDMEDECFASFFFSEAKKVCEAEELREGRKGREDCVTTAIMLSQLQPPNVLVRQCYVNENSCLRRYHYRYRHRYMRYPYSAHRSSHGFDESLQQQADNLVSSNGRDLASGWMHKSSTDKEK